MLHKLTILIAVALAGCTQSVEYISAQPMPATEAVVDQATIPAEFSIIEQHPKGYFIRVASSGRASIGSIQDVATALGCKFDRVDLCTFTAHERGDEYASIIDGKLYDYEKDMITPIN